MIQALYVAFLRDAVRAVSGERLPADHPAVGCASAEEVQDALRRLHAGSFGALRPSVARATDTILSAFAMSRTMREPRTALASLRPGALPSMLKLASDKAVPGILSRFFADLRAVAQGTVDAPVAPSVLEDAFVDFLSRPFASALDRAAHGEQAALLPGSLLGTAAAPVLASAAAARTALAAVDSFLASRRPTLTAQSPAALAPDARAHVRAHAPDRAHVRFTVDSRIDVPLRVFFAGRAESARRA